MSATNPFNRGDFVWYEDEMWQVLEVHGAECLIGDVGYKVSNVIQETVHYTELDLVEGDEDDLDDDGGDYDDDYEADDEDLEGVE